MYLLWHFSCFYFLSINDDKDRNINICGSVEIGNEAGTELKGISSIGSNLGLAATVGLLFYL